MSAVILFHSNGDILRAWTQESVSTDPLVGEAEAALLALTKASDLHISNLLFQGDSQILMESILLSYLQGSTTNLAIPWKIASIIHSLLPLFSSIPSFSPAYIPRADSLEAHSVAAWAAAHSFS
ncbi:hypothetical protein CJ030_MR1G029015 [Morella rubra]|uniref:RNase H type-1 domain-containing protein n=1 Tax=Morella rubra TaxID=262757 RepID=A0A6A1WPE6_9ROSI|nr:hypothetical protein CJ030_MR1G029015 [Morella rubra]